DFWNVPFQEQLGVIRWLARAFKPVRVVVEYSGLGMGPCEELERAGLPVSRFIPTAASKLEAYGHLKNVLEKGLLAIPASHTKLAVELRMFQFKTTDAGTVTLHHVAGQGDDFADSLCYAVWPFRGRPGKAGLVPVSMPGIDRAMSPRLAQLNRRLPPPRARPKCAVCGQSTHPGEVVDDPKQRRGP